jgi:hypothetical protein
VTIAHEDGRVHFDPDKRRLFGNPEPTGLAFHLAIGPAPMPGDAQAQPMTLLHV